MLVRPDEDSQVREAAEAWRINATEVKSQVRSSEFPTNASISSRVLAIVSNGGNGGYTGDFMLHFILLEC